MEEFSKGLYVTIVGMGLVFLSLGLIMLTIWGMERVFRQRAEQEEELALVGADQSLAEEDEVAAAIAVALLVLQGEEERRPQGKWVATVSANGGANTWTAMGRQIHMSSRYITRETKRQ